MTLRSRIAPTPSGYLHPGNAFNFVLTWLWVRKAGGMLRLRIDDLDTPRSRPEYIEDIFRSLLWLGLDWDEGPQSPDAQEQFSQLQRCGRYNEILGSLAASGKVFACRCSRSALAHGQCRCREEMTALNDTDCAWRLETGNSPVCVNDARSGLILVNLNDEMENFIVRRRDGKAAYQVASLADDIDFGINLVVRGSDLLDSTAAQLYLAAVIKEESFPKCVFYHHRLLTDSNGNKLSKSEGANSLKAMREAGIKPEKLFLELSKALGWQEPCHSLSEMLEHAKAYGLF